jgi:hypothetical protein
MRAFRIIYIMLMAILLTGVTVAAEERGGRNDKVHKLTQGEFGAVDRYLTGQIEQALILRMCLRLEVFGASTATAFSTTSEAVAVSRLDQCLQQPPPPPSAPHCSSATTPNVCSCATPRECSCLGMVCGREVRGGTINNCDGALVDSACGDL